MTGDNTSSGTRIPFREAFRFWLKLGFISFGGPAGQIAIMHDELVSRRSWISDRRFFHALNYCMLLPGPEAQQLAAYIGWLMHGVRGGLVAGFLFVFPSFLLLCSLAWLYLVYGDVSWVQGLIYGIKPAVIAIVIHAAIRIGGKALTGPVHWLLAAGAFLAITFVKIPFPWIVFSAAVIGFFAHRLAPGAFSTDGGGHGESGEITDAIIGDHIPPPRHARFHWGRTMLITMAGIATWMLAMMAVGWVGGFDGTLASMGWFFTKAALVTFGGAYAVLPYVYQGGVETYGWLTGPQMIDGLALGETTPGPLIMVVTFIGFLGGWSADIPSIASEPVRAWLAAGVVTFFTFLPSFLFILVGGPAVESTRGNLGFAAPLAAITAAVVGVILNLAVFFGLHVFWPVGFGNAFDPSAFLICLAAFLSLWRFNANVILVIGVAAVAGIFLTLLTWQSL